MLVGFADSTTVSPDMSLAAINLFVFRWQVAREVIIALTFNLLLPYLFGLHKLQRHLLRQPFHSTVNVVPDALLAHFATGILTNIFSSGRVTQLIRDGKQRVLHRRDAPSILLALAAVVNPIWRSVVIGVATALLALPLIGTALLASSSDGEVSGVFWTWAKGLYVSLLVTPAVFTMVYLTSMLAADPAMSTATADVRATTGVVSRDGVMSPREMRARRRATVVALQ